MKLENDDEKVEVKVRGWVASDEAGNLYAQVGPPTNLPGERWDREDGVTFWRVES